MKEHTRELVIRICKGVVGTIILGGIVGVIILFCWGLSKCDARDDRQRIEGYLGSGAVCSDTRDNQATCLYGNKVFMCIGRWDDGFKVACKERP